MSDPGTWRVRAGDWRILYEVNDDRLIILILDVGHRSEIY
jgi:mRNA interferase RelE/StbE